MNGSPRPSLRPVRRRRRGRLLEASLIGVVLAVAVLVGCLRSGRSVGSLAAGAHPAAGGAASVAPPSSPVPSVQVAAPSPNVPAADGLQLAPSASHPAAPAPAPAPPMSNLGAVLARAHEETFSPRDIDELEERFFVYGNALPARHAVDWYRIRFASMDRDGSPLQMTAQLFLPRAAGQALPVYAFGPGTTGLRDGCAPSHEDVTEHNWGDFEAHLLSFASQGYVAVMPDYAASPGADGLQYYYIAEMHARSLLDAARAALRFTGEPPIAGGASAGNAVFFAGYSQGGHAAFAARDNAATYAPELHVLGAIGYGPRGEVHTLLKEAPFLAPYLFYSYARVYGPDAVPLPTLLVPTITRTIAEDVTTKCIDEVPAYYGDYTPWIYQPALDDAVDHDRLDRDFPILKQLLDSNDAGRSQSATPVLILQGLADDLVWPSTQRAFVRRLCGSGASVTYQTYEDIPHVLTRQVSYRDTLDWMAALLEGHAQRSDCASVR